MNNQHLTPRESIIPAGDPAPDFTLLDQHRNEWNLAQSLEHGPVVLCFFPLAFTEVCGAEMTCVHRDFDQWKSKDARVVGISCDSFAVHNQWAKDSGYDFPLLADMHRHVCRAYGLYWPELNVASRGTVIVHTDDDKTPRVKWSQAREVMNAMDPGDILQNL